MQIKDIVFSDEAYEDLAQKYGEIGPNMQQGIDDFVSTMKSLVESKHIEGMTGDAIKLCGENMTELLSQRVESILKDQVTNTNTFVNDIVAADVFTSRPKLKNLENIITIKQEAKPWLPAMPTL